MLATEKNKIKYYIQSNYNRWFHFNDSKLNTSLYSRCDDILVFIGTIIYIGNDENIQASSLETIKTVITLSQALSFFVMSHKK